MVDWNRINSEEFKIKVRISQEERDRKESARLKTACLVGSSPEKLKDFGLGSAETSKLIQAFVEVLEIEIGEGVTTFLTGGDRGAPQIAFLCVHQLKEKYPELRNVLVVPYAKFTQSWSSEEENFFNQLTYLADETILLEDEAKYSLKGIATGEYSLDKMKKREEYFADMSSVVVSARPSVNSGYDPASGILFNSRGSGMKYWRIYTDHEYTYDARWSV